MNRFRNHCLLRAGSLRLVITYFDPLGVGLLLVFLTVLFLILGSKGGGDFAVEGGKFGFEGFKFVFVRTALVDCAKPHRPAFELGYEGLLTVQEVELVRVQRLLNRIDYDIHLIISIQLGNLVAGSYGSESGQRDATACPNDGCKPLFVGYLHLFRAYSSNRTRLVHRRYS